MTWGQVIVFVGFLAVAGFLMYVGAVTSVRWIGRRLSRPRPVTRDPSVLYLPADFGRVTPERVTRPHHRTTPEPMRPAPGPRDWEQRLRPE
jgi:hypothetical protein